MKLIIAILLLVISFSTLAAPNVGKVIKVKGEVSMLLPGKHDAQIVKMGDSIQEDTSILTEDKSFVRIKLNNKSMLMVGPKSKTVVVQAGAKEKGLVNLLKGKLRASVQGNKTRETKMYIKTRTAAMGIRGTEFQTTYNPSNKVTSLVTFKGEVAMAKIKDVPIKQSVGSDTKVLEKAIKKSVAKNEAAIVKQGRYAGVSDNLKSATKPVKISPKQFTLLKINKDLDPDAKAIPKEKLEKEIKATEKAFAKMKEEPVGVKQKEGTFNTKTGQYKPKSGGFVDLESGLYVPPPKDSKFDEKLKVFVSKDIGEVKETGEYVPPKGVVLDAEKGFVVDKDSEDSKEAEIQVAKLNKSIAGQIVEPKEPPKNELNNLEEDAYEKYFSIE